MKLVFMGDSTMQQNFANTYPQVGWVQALPLFLKPNVKIVNFARNGCSTKSFQDLGYYDLALKSCSKGDYCFIQFGHNDAKIENPLRFADASTDYYNNLCHFVDDIKKRGATPILLTPIYRRFFESEHILKPNCHLKYPDYMKLVAENKNVLLIDTCQLTKELLEKLGDENSKRLFMQFPPHTYENYPDGMTDNTHLRFDGAYLISKIVVDELLKIKHPLKKHFKFEVSDD